MTDEDVLAAVGPRLRELRSKRDVTKGKLAPRSAEIQRLVGRALRA